MLAKVAMMRAERNFMVWFSEELAMGNWSERYRYLFDLPRGEKGLREEMQGVYQV